MKADRTSIAQIAAKRWNAEADEFNQWDALGQDEKDALIAAEQERLSRLKLTPVQQEVMRWLSQKWEARVSVGSAVEINGDRVCNVSTMNALVRLGLVERESQAQCWVATAEGRKLSPNYIPVEGE